MFDVKMNREGEILALDEERSKKMQERGNDNESDEELIKKHTTYDPVLSQINLHDNRIWPRN